MDESHRLEGGVWIKGEKVVDDVATLMHAAIGRKFGTHWCAGKLLSIQGEFTAEEKVIIKQIAEDNGVA